MRCLNYRVVLRAYYAVSGTEHAFGAISIHASYAMSGTELVHAATRPTHCPPPSYPLVPSPNCIARYQPTRLLRDVQYRHCRMVGTGPRAGYAMCSTDVAYAVYAMCGGHGTHTASTVAGTPRNQTQAPELLVQVVLQVVLKLRFLLRFRRVAPYSSSYASSAAHPAMLLPGEAFDPAIPDTLVPGILLRTCYEMAGTDRAYAATRTVALQRDSIGGQAMVSRHRT
eukprot:2183325-Rhodomonas_salina.3